MALNPNWPLIDFAVCFGAGPADSTVQNYWCDLTSRTEGSVSSQRGKTYELDQVQPGQLSVTLRNDDGVLDPSNSAGPFAGHVLPYRLFRARAQWPPTPNMLTADQATAFYSSKGAAGAGSTLPWGVLPVSGHTCSIVNVGTVNHYRAPFGLGDVWAGVEMTGFSVEPGQTYTASAMVSISGGSTAVVPGFVFYDASGNVISTPVVPTYTVGAAQELSVTQTAPANAAGARAIFQLTGTATTFAGSIDVWDLQVEVGSSASAWQQPGEWFPLFTGYVERWPQSWQSGGNYGLSSLTVVDLFSFLANHGLNYAGYLEMIALDPDWFYPLDEGSGATQFTDAMSKRPPVGTYTFNGYFAGADPGSVTAGASLSAAKASGLPLGIPGGVVQFNNKETGGAQIATIDLSAAAPDGGNPGPPATGQWCRIMAVNSPAMTSSDGWLPTIWLFGPDLQDSGTVRDGWFYIDNGAIAGQSLPLNHGNFDGVDVGVVADGNWHLYAFAFDSSTKKFTAWRDGVQVVSMTAAGALVQPGCKYDFFGGWPDPSGARGYYGQLSFIAQLGFVPTGTQMSNLYHAFMQAWGTYSGHTETSDGRYARLLGWINNQAPTRLSAGSSKKYGPGTDFQGGTTPTSTLAALQAVVDSECGQHFVAADGTLVFQARYDRFNLAPVVTFGELAGEIPYTDAKLDFDPTRVGNDVTTTAQNQIAAAASTANASDAASIADYGTMTFGRTVNTIDPGELQYVAEALLYQNRQPLQRLETLPINVAVNPSTWPTLLGLELGSCVKVMRRPANAPAISITGFVEQIQWSLSDKGAATCSLQVSNNDAHLFCALDDATYGLLDSTAILGF